MSGFPNFSPRAGSPLFVSFRPTPPLSYRPCPSVYLHHHLCTLPSPPLSYRPCTSPSPPLSYRPCTLPDASSALPSLPHSVLSPDTIAYLLPSPFSPHCFSLVLLPTSSPAYQSVALWFQALCNCHSPRCGMGIRRESDVSPGRTRACT
jgi:hypothetical protein